MLNKVNKYLHTPTWLFVLLILVLIMRVPSFFEPYSYGDETIYLTLGQAIRSGIPLYSGIHDNKPPLLYIMAAIAGSLFLFKAILALWMLVTIYIFWKLTAVLIPKNIKTQIVATVVFAILTTIPLLEGNIVNAELFMIGPIILAYLVAITKKPTFKNIFISGLIISIATLFKVPAAFDVFPIVFIWLIDIKKVSTKSILALSKQFFYLLLGFLTPILFTFVWFYLQGSFGDYFKAAFMQNFGYLSTWRPGDVQQNILARNAPLLFRGSVVFVGALILYIKKRSLSTNFTFVTAWLLSSLFAATLSERPYPHYLVQIIGPFSLLLAFFFTKKTKEQVYSLIPLFILFGSVVRFGFWYYPSTPYYIRFFNLITGKIHKDDYLRSFGSNVVSSYAIADYINSSSKPEDKIFVWGNDSSIIYSLTKKFPPEKYIEVYHINDFAQNGEVISKLERNKPQFIVVNTKMESLPGLSNIIQQNYGLVKTTDDYKIWKLLSPRVRSLMRQLI